MLRVPTMLTKGKAFFREQRGMTVLLQVFYSFLFESRQVSSD